MGQKLSSKLLFIYSPYSEWFYIFHISQGSVATQLRCGGMFGNHFITNFPQNAPVKKFWESVNIWQRYGQNFVAYFFEPPCSSLCFPISDRSFILELQMPVLRVDPLVEMMQQCAQDMLSYLRLSVLYSSSPGWDRTSGATKLLG